MPEWVRSALALKHNLTSNFRIKCIIMYITSQITLQAKRMIIMLISNRVLSNSKQPTVYKLHACTVKFNVTVHLLIGETVCEVYYKIINVVSSQVLPFFLFLAALLFASASVQWRRLHSCCTAQPRPAHTPL